jgi:hypothetical protein
MKEYRFFYHYNKYTGGMTIHFRGACYAVKNTLCMVESQSKWNKRQPHLVMQGWAREVWVTRKGWGIIR